MVTGSPSTDEAVNQFLAGRLVLREPIRLSHWAERFLLSTDAAVVAAGARTVIVSTLPHGTKHLGFIAIHRIALSGQPQDTTRGVVKSNPCGIASHQMDTKAQLAANHNVGSVHQTDVDGMLRWLEFNRDTFIAYYNGRIGLAEFDARLGANPYP